MNILYDYQGFSNKVSGASRSFCEVLSVLSEKNKINIGTIICDNLYLIALKPTYRSFFSKIHFKGKSKITKFINKSYCLYKIRKNDFDLFNVTGEDCYFLDSLRKPFVFTIHDMIPENYYTNSSRITNREKLIKKANRIVVVSENTKRELLEKYSNIVSKDKIDVIYHGYKVTKVDYLDNINGRYILYVGERNAYKNFLFTINALLPLLNEDVSLKIFCVGPKFNNEESNFFAKHNIINKITANYVSEIELNSLYKNALVFVYPSLYEGFGIPILEAFGNGCPACISNTSCFPEIAGDAVQYFDPTNEKSILTAVKKVIDNKLYSDLLIEKGKKRVAQFTWEETAKKMLSTYEKALN